MLKALELTGFKSFADKTRFEFPPGITVIVGPNGSGKSNLVDAIKWVLGEQSAKSLRGKDMADVIFKGSGDGGRRVVNAAEATIIFDNAERRIAVDATEVHITRRVYRSGEGEYLINHEPCRLKDVRTLFRGTGVGADAYSLIEQGKVDQMLQASARERRATFEEAAGISRFKAKKVEARRRLERVEQNLLRLQDIVAEVEHRLRSVRAQASKARRYREYRDRLQELRTNVGLTDWRHLTEQLQTAEAKLSQLRAETAEWSAQSEACEARCRELESAVHNAVEAMRLCENRTSAHREQIAARQSSIEQARDRVRDLNESLQQARQQRVALSERSGDLQQRLGNTCAELQQAESASQELSQRTSLLEERLHATVQQFEQLSRQRDVLRETHMRHMRDAANFQSRISSLASQREGWQASAQRARRQLDELTGELESCTDALASADRTERQLVEQLETACRARDSARAQSSLYRQQREETRQELTTVQQRRTAVHERISVLEELDQSQEGLASGVREVLDLASEAADGAFVEVQGLVADLIQVSVEMAPLVDVALGEKAQYIVVEGNQLTAEIQSSRYRPSGRVGFIPVNDSKTDSRMQEPPPQEEPGIIRRFDQLVAADPRLAGLVYRLLGDTWCVETLSHALSARQRLREPPRFVTLAGELVETDGTIVVGSRLSTTGLVSRRNELRSLKSEMDRLASREQSVQSELDRLTSRVAEQDQTVAEREAGHRHDDIALADHRVRTRALRQRCEQLERQRHDFRKELESAEAQRSQAEGELEHVRRQLADLEDKTLAVETSLRTMEQDLQALAEQRHAGVREVTSTQVELARREQHRETLRLVLQQLEKDRQERSRIKSEIELRLEQDQRRLAQTEREILQATSELAGLYLHNESLAREFAQWTESRDSAASQRAECADQSHALRRRIERSLEKQHEQDLDAGRIRLQMATLADRLREDYEIDIAALEQQATPQQIAEREEIEREIADLRRKINSLGAVNLAALEELDALEARFAALSSQFQDLTQAKDNLERIIQKIDTDSRRLFLETLEAIRSNFQLLYRKAFGGGRADLVLEEGVDVLEAGVDIIATPPGKPTFSNSLLSGGEKALTAVALLLAVFQYRPSPFCVLDEVDAPFDEANIGRFVEVLKEFLGWTKFVIVTHSKKTMTAADTLYGVTMQESGVSKRVSVRFEDVSEDGQISDDAARRESCESENEQRAA